MNKKLRLTVAAVYAAAATILSTVGVTASAYDITSSNYQKLTYNYHGAGPGYCWGTTEQQNALPKLTTQFLSPVCILHCSLNVVSSAAHGCSVLSMKE